jgi:hypothetical protein
VSPGNKEFVEVVAEMLAVPAVQAAIVRFDEKRLDPRRLERAWPPVTRDAVVFATWQFGILFGCPALVVWFVRTRTWRSVAGWALGLASAAGLLATAIGAALGSEAAIDWLGL